MQNEQRVIFIRIYSRIELELQKLIWIKPCEQQKEPDALKI